MKKKITLIIITIMAVFALFFIKHKIDGQPYNYYSNTWLRASIDSTVLNSDRTMVALVFGQSNSANHGETKYQPEGNVYNWYNGEIYKAKDPMLGASGDSGSVWTRLGDKLIKKGLYDKVVFVPIGVGSTSINEWAEGELNERLINTLKKVKVTHIMFHQGETDVVNKTSKETYTIHLNKVIDDIRKYSDAPIYISIVSTAYGASNNEEVKQAQLSVINVDNKIYKGAETDDLTGDCRIKESSHFSAKGLDKFADMWVDILR